MFAVDWPFNSNVEAVEFMRAAVLSPQEKRRIFGGKCVPDHLSTLAVQRWPCDLHATSEAWLQGAQSPSARPA